MLAGVQAWHCRCPLLTPPHFDGGLFGAYIHDNGEKFGGIALRGRDILKSLQQSQEPGTRSRSPTWVQRLPLLEPWPAASQGAHALKAGIGSRARTSAGTCVWDVGIPAAWLHSCSTCPFQQPLFWVTHSSSSTQVVH